MKRKPVSALHDKIYSSMPALRLVLKNGPIDQSSVAKKLGITLPAAYNHFQKLKKEGLVKTIRKAESLERGRPSILWDVYKNANFTISLVIVPPLLLMGVSDFDDQLVFFKQSDLSAIREQSELFDLFEKVLAECKHSVGCKNNQIRSVSIGLPGYLDNRYVVEYSANMPLLTGMNFNSYFAQKHGLFCTTHSHYYNFYYAEMLELPPNTTLSVIQWELGLGHVAGRNKQIFNITPNRELSRTGLQDIAHMRVVKDGRKCSCGNSGCLEAYTGGWSIIKQLDRKDITTLADLIYFAEKDDDQVLEELSCSAKFLGTQMGWVVRFLGIDRIVITGPLSQVFDKVNKSFCQGLCKGGLTKEEVKSLNLHASPDSLRKMTKGGCYIAKSLFFDPETFAV